MLNYRFKAILKREVRQQIFTKKFVITTLSIPLIMILSLSIQAFVMTYDKDEKATLHLLSESENIQSLLQSQFDQSEFNNTSLYEFVYLPSSQDELPIYVERHRSELLRGQITGIIFVPDSAYTDKQISYYSNNPSNQNLLARLREHVNKAMVGRYFSERGIADEAVAYARTNVSIDGIRVTEGGNSEVDAGNMIVAIGLTVMVYISLLSMGPAVLAAVNEEKTNRIVEVLLSTVTPGELMYGKVIGTAITGLVQIAIWISPVLVLSLVSLPALMMFNQLDLSLSFFNLSYFLLNYLIGLLTFLSIFAAFGAMFDTPQDAQGSLMPIIMLVMIPFLLAFSLLRNPANMVAEICSMLPFASIMIMPARMTLIDVPVWQLGVALMVNFLTIYFCIRGAAKIYRTTILLSGKRPSWSEIWKWLRYS